MIKAFNSLTENLEPIPDTGKNPLHLFVCGPTVYDYPHIGNARTYLAFDIIVRYLRSAGRKVFYLQNITDIDDKIIKRAREEKSTAKDIAQKFEAVYHQNEKALGIISVTKYARATGYINAIVKQVTALLQKGHAYKIENDGYYFDLSTFPEYGKLSRRTSLQAEDATSRIDEGINKRNKGDFALWKFKKDADEPSWKTSLGEGRPGWHIEDTAISETFFGPQYDIHGGAVDLKFPHHDAEIAQQEAASGKKPFVKLWLHTGFLLVDGKKMSKSLGNFISIDDFVRRYSAETLRFIVASHHYRSPIDFKESLVQQASQSLARIRNFLGRLTLIKTRNPLRPEIQNAVATAAQKFEAAMSEDFNTPQALAVIFELISGLEKNIWGLNRKEASLISDHIIAEMKRLGFNLKISSAPFMIRRLAAQREAARRSKDFTAADILRKKAETAGFIIEDTPLGPYIFKHDNLG